MLRKRVFPIATVAMALALGGCSPAAVKETHFRSVELAPVSEGGVVLVADLQVIGTKKVLGSAKGAAKTPEQENNLRVQALEAALASDSSGPDVLVAPSYIEEKAVDSMTITIVGYPARYKDFRRKTTPAHEQPPFLTKQLPNGATVISYDRNAYTVKLVNDNMIAVQAIKSNAPAIESGASTTNQTGE